MCAPAAGSLEWVVEELAQVTAQQVIAWLSVVDHCALRPVLAPCDGSLTYRRSIDLPDVAWGRPVALIGDDAEALEACRGAERSDAMTVHRALLAERARLEFADPSPLREALLRDEAQRLTERLERLERLLR